MNATSVFCRGVACACVLGAFVYPALTQGGESSIDTRSPALASTNDLDQGLFPWGDPQYTDGARNLYPRPVWILAACRDGGLWITNDTCYGWQPALGEWQADLATNRLLIQLDRAQAPSNLWLAVVGVGDPEAALLAGTPASAGGGCGPIHQSYRSLTRPNCEHHRPLRHQWPDSYLPVHAG